MWWCSDIITVDSVLLLGQYRSCKKNLWSERKKIVVFIHFLSSYVVGATLKISESIKSLSDNLYVYTFFLTDYNFSQNLCGQQMSER